jgi:hypothetical protein
MSCDCNTLVVGEAGAPGPQGLAGANGTNGTNGLNAFTTTSASFTQPSSIGATVTFYVVENRWIAVGQTVYISEAGFYTVTDLGGSPSFSSVTADLISVDGVAVGATVSSGRKVSPSASAVYSAPLASLTVTTGGVSSLDGPVTINESGNNADVRIEGFGDTHLLFCDANAGTTGRVGISTSSPLATLHVDGTFKVGDAGSPADAEFTRGVVFNSLQSGSGTDGDFVVKTKTVSNTFFVDASADSVGIGTNSPSKLLDVNGAAEMNTLLVNPGGVQANPSFQVYGTNSTRPITVLSTSAPFNGVGIFKATPTVELDVVGATTITGATILGSTLAVAGDLSVDTSVLKVDVTGNFVGINKTTPTVPLDVVGATNISGDLSVDTNVLKVDVTGNFVGINKTTPTVALDVVGATTITGATILSGNLSVDTNVLKVDVTGNFVGINKTTPTVALDVVGATNISGDLTVSTEDFYVDTTNHKVGINTDEPATALDVVGSVQASDYRISTGSGAAKLTGFYFASTTIVSIASITAGATTASSAITVTGAALGDFVQVTYGGSLPVTDFKNIVTVSGYVSATNAVVILLANNSAGATTAQTNLPFNILVTRAAAS